MICNECNASTSKICAKHQSTLFKTTSSFFEDAQPPEPSHATQKLANDKGKIRRAPTTINSLMDELFERAANEEPDKTSE